MVIGVCRTALSWCIMCCYNRLQGQCHSAAKCRISLRRLLPTIKELHAITEELFYAWQLPLFKHCASNELQREGCFRWRDTAHACMLHPALRLAFAALVVSAFHGHRAGAAAHPYIYKPSAWTVLGGIAAVKLSGMPCRTGTPSQACTWAPTPASAVILHSYGMGCPLQPGPGMPATPHIYCCKRPLRGEHSQSGRLVVVVSQYGIDTIFQSGPNTTHQHLKVANTMQCLSCAADAAADAQPIIRNQNFVVNAFH